MRGEVLDDEELGEIPHLFQCLSWEEFSLVFAISFIDKTEGFEGAYPIAQFATPGFEGDTDDWSELFRRTIRYLARSCDIQFEGIAAKGDGRLLCRMVEPGNALYIGLMRTGCPNPIIQIERALGYLNASLDSLVDREPMHDMLHALREDVVAMGKRVNRDKLDKLFKFRDEALASVGVVRVGKETIH